VGEMRGVSMQRMADRADLGVRAYLFQAVSSSLRSQPMRRLLRAVAANCHAAPAPRPAPGLICEQKRAGRALARLYVGEIARAHKPRKGFGDRPRWRDIPSWFLIADQDYMIQPGTQRFMADRMRARVRTHQVDHTPSVTAPQVVVDVIREAIADVGPR
jgi:pimeloyl-ACP methyl ester carboxylesterase